ncbi:MAG: hypothetical protein WD872_12685 [Pirellulaceae bacterium]
MARIAIWGLLLGQLVWPLAACCQDAAAPPAGTTPLGVRQQRVERMMEDLERKFISLQRSLGETEPERAKKLKETFDKAKELLIQQRMGDVTKLLDQARLDTATEGQKAILTDIRTLLEILLDEKSDRDKAREEFERLSEWKKQIEKLIGQEKGAKRESDKVSDKAKALADLQAKIKALEKAIEAQKQVIGATEEARAEGIQGLGKIAGEQGAVRQQAQAIANQIAKEAGDKKGPFEADTPQANPPGDAKPGEAKPAEAKPGEAAEGAAESPSAPAASESAPNIRPAEPGEKPLGQAIADQQAAEGKLQEGKGKAAQQDEQTALSNLQRALGELKNEQSRIASLPPEAFEKMAGKQDDIKNQTANLDQKMQQAGSQSSGQPGGEGGADGAGKPQPGQQKVQQAQKSMQQASGDLRKQEPKDASRQQGKAIQDLEAALQEIEERLAQLREETQLEKLARLEGRFREMLARQQMATLDTAAFETKRQAEGELKRSDRLALGKVSAEEGALAEAAQLALDIILDDGTSVVFPDVVEQVRDDLLSVKKLLDTSRTDAYTQTLQKEIEITLEELIEALQQAQQQKESTGSGGGGGGGMEPLLPNSAELKLLRSAQLRINRRTLAIDAARPKDAELDETLRAEAQTITGRQAEIAEMTIQILERGP